MKTGIVICAAWCVLLAGTGLACKDKIVEMTGISVSPASILLVYGGTPNSQQITAEAIPENATGVKFTWAAGNKAVATVSESGLITATGIGSTQVSVMANNRSRQIPVMEVGPDFESQIGMLHTF